jgi:hypothetical protein
VKLWQVVQWGNVEIDGADGAADTQCLVSAIDLPSAVLAAEAAFRARYEAAWQRPPARWRGQIGCVYLIGADFRPNGEAVIITSIRIAPALNMGRNACWLRDSEAGEWRLQDP